MTTIKIVVIGLPAPQGSKKLVGTYKDKETGVTRGMMAEASTRTKPWRKLVDAAGAAVMSMNRLPALDGPLIARMVFTMPKPKSAPKSRRTYPDRKPDVSKLMRSTEDALTTSKVIADDARIVEYSRVAKVFPGEDPEALTMPGVVITISTIE